MRKKRVKTIISTQKNAKYLFTVCCCCCCCFFLIIVLWPQFPPLSREAVDEHIILGDRTKLIFQEIMSKDASNEESQTRL